MKTARIFTPFLAVVAAVAFVFALTGIVEAAARPYAFIQGTESLPDSGLELESWVGGALPEDGPIGWEWWLGPVVGWTDQLETGLFTIFDQGVAPTVSGLQLQSLRAQISYLLKPKGDWPVDVRLRGEVGVPVGKEAYNTEWLQAFLAHDWKDFNLTGNVGAWLKHDDGEVEKYIVYGLGASYQIKKILRLGFEAPGEMEFEGGEIEQRLSMGPSLAVGHGRLWASSAFTFGMGKEVAQRQGRIVLGLSF